MEDDSTYLSVGSEEHSDVSTNLSLGEGDSTYHNVESVFHIDVITNLSVGKTIVLTFV